VGWKCMSSDNGVGPDLPMENDIVQQNVFYRKKA
jgi:hypothetical protein